MFFCGVVVRNYIYGYLLCLSAAVYFLEQINLDINNGGIYDDLLIIEVNVSRCSRQSQSNNNNSGIINLRNQVQKMGIGV